MQHTVSRHQVCASDLDSFREDLVVVVAGKPHVLVQHIGRANPLIDDSRADHPW